MFRNAPVIAALLVAAAGLGPLAMGCEVATAVDRSQIPSSGGASATSTTTATTSTATSSVSTGVGGAGGSGTGTGTGGETSCAAPTECMDTAGDCKTPTCK